MVVCDKAELLADRLLMMGFMFERLAHQAFLGATGAALTTRWYEYQCEHVGEHLG